MVLFLFNAPYHHKPEIGSLGILSKQYLSLATNEREILAIMVGQGEVTGGQDLQDAVRIPLALFM